MIAEEFLKQYQNNTTHYADQEYSEYNLIIALKKFAEYHVTEALKAASEKAEITWDALPTIGDFQIIDKESILNAYPLNNIK